MAAMRGVLVAMSLLLAACPHATPKPGLDDAREGAVAIPKDPEYPERWRLDGTLDAGAGDAVDWAVLELPPGQAHTIIVSVVSEGGTFDADVFGVAGLLGHTSKLGDAAFASVVDRIYVRVSATATRSRGAYSAIVDVLSSERLADPNAPPKCDPDAYDASNPNCRGECDYQHPDATNPECCGMWWKCKKQNEWSCETRDAQVQDDVVTIPLGTRQGVFGHPRGELILTEREPRLPEERLDEELRQQRSRVELSVLQIDTDTSYWKIEHAKSHDLPWIASHLSHVRLDPPRECPFAQP
jgi:hypothetical protein